MESLEHFVKELSENNNLEKLQKSIEAYNKIPIYFVDKYKCYIDSKYTGYKIWVYAHTVLVIDIVTAKDRNYSIDINFAEIKGVSFTLWVRTRTLEKSEKKTILEELKNNIGEDFPFKKPVEEWGDEVAYRLEIQNIFDDNAITNLLDTLLEIGKKYMI